MSKHAIVSFIDGLRREMRKWSVTVHGIEPMMYRQKTRGTEISKYSSVKESSLSDRRDDFPAWRESGKQFSKNHPQSPDQDVNLYLPVIGSLVYWESGKEMKDSFAFGHKYRKQPALLRGRMVGVLDSDE
uniref:Uncharacterized protein n=1 Tax=Timema tahoe TaxID=61484 RepID=A0A7R9ITH9_9NEOP|nr:unnamed protein product [Timema tahoe]